MTDKDVAISDYINSATISVDAVEQLSRMELLAIIKEYKFCRITGLLDAKQIKRSRKLLEEQFCLSNDNPVYGDTPQDVKSNFQKLSIGRARHGGVDRPRFMRVFYNPIWAEDIYQLRNIFIRIAQVRNILGDLHRDFAITEVENGMWTAARVHLFPAGGGFMTEHKDTVLPSVLKKSGIAGGYYQPVALLTQKGVDYHKGGGTLELEGKIIEYEDYTTLGDIIIYDATTCHGVSDIDPDLPFRQNSLRGRMSGLVTLYKNLDD